MTGRLARAALLCVLALSGVGLSAASAEAVGDPLAGAARVGPAPSSQQIPLLLPLKADDAGLRAFTLAVTTPGSPEYAQYEPVSELARRFGASAVTRARVVRFLRAAGAEAVKIDATGLFADATVSVRVAERLFTAPLASFRAAHAARFIAPTAVAVIPAPLRGLVTDVVGLDTRPVFHTAAQPSSAMLRTGTPAGCPAGIGTGGYTPNQYLSAYDYGPLYSAGFTGQDERAALIEIDGFRFSDIKTFANCFSLRIPSVNGFGVGLAHPLAPGSEATLDLEILDATAPGLKAIDVYESSASEAAGLRALAAPLQNSGFKPDVISVSIGLCEPAVIDAVGASGIDAAEASLELAAASGITILVATGDSGSAACAGPDGQPAAGLAVNYPASSWWVTAVGGTNFALSAANQIVNQIVWNDTDLAPGAAGGGGFSAGFQRPPYQNGTVSQNSRALPDVSMLADPGPGYAIYCSASPDCVNSHNSDPWTAFGGTSAATPLLAGGMALIDEALRKHGKQDLGLVNPLLYAIGRTPSLASQVFDDVTQYSNDVGPALGFGPLGCCNASTGFDEASGWGSVYLGNLARVAIAEVPKIVSVGLALPGNQKPIAKGKIMATVSCSGACLMRAFAKVRVSGGPSFQVGSNVSLLRAKGHRTVSITFSAKQKGQLQAALGRKQIVATVFGATYDPGGNLEKQTKGIKLTIKG